MTPQLWLASNSPRRRVLLSLAGWQFQVRAVEIDEQPLPGEPADAYVTRLAETKARAAQALVPGGDIVLAADTTVADGDVILGKPASADQARAMLMALRGRDHTVLTAISAMETTSGRQSSDLCRTRVWMRLYSDEEIGAYIASGDPMDKAGAYAVQHPGFRPVSRIEGCYSCVVGLPLCRVHPLLAQFGLAPAADDLTEGCPPALAQDRACDVYQELLRFETSQWQ